MGLYQQLSCPSSHSAISVSAARKGHLGQLKTRQRLVPFGTGGKKSDALCFCISPTKTDQTAFEPCSTGFKEKNQEKSSQSQANVLIQSCLVIKDAQGPLSPAQKDPTEQFPCCYFEHSLATAPSFLLRLIYHCSSHQFLFCRFSHSCFSLTFSFSLFNFQTVKLSPPTFCLFPISHL